MSKPSVDLGEAIAGRLPPTKEDVRKESKKMRERHQEKMAECFEQMLGLVPVTKTDTPNPAFKEQLDKCIALTSEMLAALQKTRNKNRIYQMCEKFYDGLIELAELYEKPASDRVIEKMNDLSMDNLSLIADIKKELDKVAPTPKLDDRISI